MRWCRGPGKRSCREEVPCAWRHTERYFAHRQVQLGTDGQGCRGRRGCLELVDRFASDADDSDVVSVVSVLVDRCVDALARDCAARAGTAWRSMTVVIHSAAPGVSTQGSAASATYSIASRSSPIP
jgi:hypothetical protein